MTNITKGFEVLTFVPIGDERGQLVALEGNQHIPFDIKRVFYVYGTSGDKARGCHANKKTRFVIISLSGNCIISVNDGKKVEDIKLDTKTKGLYLDCMVWKEMHSFSDDCILLVLCSEFYDSTEYIHDLEQFLTLVN